MPALGALVVSLALTFRPIRHNSGKLMLVCVGLYGAATVVFGLSHAIWLSLLALVIVGASDMVSVVIRASMLQLATPPWLRGRVSAVNGIFVGASNELGGYESGQTAQWWGAVPSVVVGGIGAILVTGLACGLFPVLRKADALSAESLMKSNQQQGVSKPLD
jgi:MFS family permease